MSYCQQHNPGIWNNAAAKSVSAKGNLFVQLPETGTAPELRQVL